MGLSGWCYEFMLRGEWARIDSEDEARSFILFERTDDSSTIVP